MDITQTHRLSETEKAEIGRLVDACNAHDGTEMGIYLSNEFNFFPEMDCFFLCRDGGELVGFLCAASDDGKESEIGGCVLPRARGARGSFGSCTSARGGSTAGSESKRPASNRRRNSPTDTPLWPPFTPRSTMRNCA